VPGSEPDPRRWRILGVSLVVGFMALLDITIVNIAIPSMRSALGTSASTIQWVVSGYALAFGLTLVAGGRLGDAYGRRRMMAVGLVGFVASSAAVGLATSVELVIVARLAQGATAGLLTPQNAGLIQQLFSGAERGRAFGFFGMTVAVASAIGPVVGGGIIGIAGEQHGWRYLFLINVPIGLVALLFVLRLVPGRPDDAPDEPASHRIDVVGALVLGAAVLCLLFPVVGLESGARRPLVLLAAVPVLAFAFVRWERRLTRLDLPPLLDVALLRRLPGYASGMAVQTLYFTGFTGVFLVLSVFLQEGRDLDALHAGLLLTPFAIGAAVTAPVAGHLVSRVGPRITPVALTAMMTGVLLVAVIAPGRDTEDLWWTLSPALLVAGLGGGAVVSPNITLSLAEVPPRMGGAAGAALQTGSRIGSSLGAAALVTVYQLGDGATPGRGLRTALLTALVVLAGAMVAALARSATRSRPAAAPDATTPPRRR
jgi:EmrB/QacA subfamily drug resistance transporter